MGEGEGEGEGEGAGAGEGEGEGEGEGALSTEYQYSPYSVWFPCPGSEMKFLLHPQNTTVLEGESYSMECVVLHTSPAYLYFINFTNYWLYPTASGFPTLTIESVSLAEHDGVHYACLCGPSGTYNIGFIASWPSVLNVHGRYTIHVLVRDEKEGRKKQARSDKQQVKATQHTQGRGLEPTTL